MKNKNGLLELAFLEKNKTQHSFIKHFFQKYLPLSIFSYLPMLIFQNKHLFLSTIWCEEVPLRLCPTNYPSSNCHLLPMAQKMTSSTTGRAEHSAVISRRGPFTCYLWDRSSRGKNTELYFCVQIKFGVLLTQWKMCVCWWLPSWNMMIYTWKHLCHLSYDVTGLQHGCITNNHIKN